MKRTVISDKDKFITILSVDPSEKMLHTQTALYSFMLELYLADEERYEKTLKRVTAFIEEKLQK